VLVITALPAALLVAVVATPLAGGLARRLGILDRPGPLKVQRKPVPYLGGLAVFAATSAVAGGFRPGLLIPLALALALGLADDARDIGAGTRLLCEIGIGIVAGLLLSTGLAGVLGPAATAVAVVTLLNAVNLIDGLDGLASGVSMVSALGFAVLLGGDERILALALAGALGGFLVYNRPPARIYLGDAGSYFVGTALALLLASAWDGGQSVANGIAAIGLVGAVLGETAVAIIRRWRARRPLFEGDRSHLYDQLVDRGWPVRRVLVFSIAIQVTLTAVAIVAATGTPAVAAATMLACALAMLAAVWSGGFLGERHQGGPDDPSRSFGRHARVPRRTALRPANGASAGGGHRAANRGL